MKKIKKTISNSRLFFSLKSEDLIDRRKNILNILLIFFSFVAILTQISLFLNEFTSKNENPKITWVPALALMFFLVLIKLSQLNKNKIAAFLFLSVLFVLIFHSSIEAGIDNPQTIVIYSLIITMSGILIGQNFSLISTTVICISLLAIFLLNQKGLIVFDRNWRLETFNMVDALALLLSYMVMAIVSWLFSREINNSLKRALKSEKEALNLAKELQREKESLEIKVEKRTKELKESQLNEFIKINSLAEFGRISAGLLHDIKNPLTVISLNLDSLQNSSKDKTRELVNKSLLAAKTAEDIIKSSQKQLLDEEEKQEFDLIAEIKNSLILVEHRAERENVKIVFNKSKEIIIEGYPSKFSRILVNLVMNAIDSFEGTRKRDRKIEILTTKNKNNIVVEVVDNGCGISEKDKTKLFEPLFSRKKGKDRMGLGLYSSKKIVKESFDGEIEFESELEKGSKFTVIIPIK